MDEDGLIAGGEPGAQLTWMDAKVGDWLVTPRHGKPVEIQALWVRALEVGERLATQFGDSAYAARCREDRTQAVASFRTSFGTMQADYLYDVIDGPEGNDASIRPNQLYAVALSDDLVTGEQAATDSPGRGGPSADAGRAADSLAQGQPLSPAVRRFGGGARRSLPSRHGLAVSVGTVYHSLA